MVREDRGGWRRACACLRWVAFPKQAGAARVGRQIGGGGRMWQVKRDSGASCWCCWRGRALGRRMGPLARAGIFRAIDFSVRIQCQRQAIAPKPAVCPALPCSLSCCAPMMAAARVQTAAIVIAGVRRLCSAQGGIGRWARKGWGGEGYTKQRRRPIFTLNGGRPGLLLCS